jgi:hypothetical protein
MKYRASSCEESVLPSNCLNSIVDINRTPDEALNKQTLIEGDGAKITISVITGMATLVIIMSSQ